MVAVMREMAGARARNGDAAALGAADWLSLAATPTFAFMALLTGVFGAPQDAFCVTSHEASSLSGMLVMYLLMSAFHAASWLRLISRRQSDAR